MPIRTVSTVTSGLQNYNNFLFFLDRLELAILNLQRKNPMVAKVYDLLHLVWKTYHFSEKSRRELNALGEQLGVGVCTPSSVKGTRWIPHMHRALSTLLKSEKNGDLAADSGQYAVTFHHMEHLATSAASADILGRAKMVSFIIYMLLSKS